MTDQTDRGLKRGHIILVIVALLVVAAIVVFIFCWPAITGTVDQAPDDIAKVELTDGETYE